MKKLLALLLMLPALAWATNPTIRSNTINSAAIGGTSFTSAAITTATGDTVVMFVAVQGGTATVTPSDSKSNSCWASPTLGGLGNPVHDTNDGSYLYVKTCVNLTSGGTGHTFSVSLSGNSLSAVEVIDIQNAATSSTIDVSNAAYGTAYPLSGSVTPTVSGDLILGEGMTTCCNSNTVTATGASYTSLEHYAGTADLTALGSGYLANATTSSTDPLMTMSHTTGQGFVVVTLGIKGTGGAPTTSPSQFLLGASLWQRPVSLEAMAR